jgi:hypothetical protein
MHTNVTHQEPVTQGGSHKVSENTSQRAKLWMLYALPLLAALGPHASLQPINGSSQNLYRLVALALLAPTLIAIWSVPRFRCLAPKALIGVGVLWILLAPIALASTPDRIAGVSEATGISFSIIGALTLLAIAPASERAMRALRSGWVLAFYATAAVGIWEIVTGEHLGGNATLAASDVHYAASTLYNPNDYAGFLLAALPALASGLATSRNNRNRWFFSIALLLWLCLNVATQSRTGIIGIVLAAPILIWWVRRSSRYNDGRPLFPWTFIAGFAGLALAAVSTLAAAQNVTSDFQSPFEENQSNSYSDQTRVNLSRVGLRILVDSGFLGSGAGSFERAVAGAAGYIDVAGITNAHNALVEFAAEYGLLIALALATVIASSVYQAFRRIGKDPRTDTIALNLRMSIGFGGAAFVASSLVGSSTLASPWWWILIGTIASQAAVLSRRIYDREESKESREMTDVLVGHNLRSNQLGNSARSNDGATAHDIRAASN